MLVHVESVCYIVSVWNIGVVVWWRSLFVHRRLNGCLIERCWLKTACIKIYDYCGMFGFEYQLCDTHKCATLNNSLCEWGTAWISSVSLWVRFLSWLFRGITEMMDLIWILSAHHLRPSLRFWLIYFLKRIESHWNLFTSKCDRRCVSWVTWM